MKHRYHWLTHIAVGLVLVTISWHQYSVELLLSGFIVFVSTSSAPDIDIALPIKHRGFSHTLLATLLVGYLSYYVINVIGGPGMFFGTVIAFGYGLHILEDMLTTGGVSLLWPVTGLSISMTPFKHDSVFFTFLAWIALVSAIGFVLHSFGFVNMIDMLSYVIDI